MVVKSLIGALVVCHLIVGGNTPREVTPQPTANPTDTTQPGETPPAPDPNAAAAEEADTTTDPNIFKLYGKIIQETTDIQIVEHLKKKEAIQQDVEMVLVQGLNSPGVYKIRKSACMLVRKETPEEKDLRLNGSKKKIKEVVAPSSSEKKVEDKKSSSSPSTLTPAPTAVPQVEPSDKTPVQKSDKSMLDYMLK